MPFALKAASKLRKSLIAIFDARVSENPAVRKRERDAAQNGN